MICLQWKDINGMIVRPRTWIAKVLVNILVLAIFLDDDQTHQGSSFSSYYERAAFFKPMWPEGISEASGVAQGLLQSGELLK